LLSLAGSKDTEKLTELTAIAERECGSHAASVIEVLEKFVMEGIPVPGLAQERQEHHFAVRVLTQMFQRPAPGALDSVRFSALDDLAKKKRKSDSKGLLLKLTNGRPLFGRELLDPAIGYSYLTYEEIQELRPILKTYRPKKKGLPPFDPEYARALANNGFATQVKFAMGDYSSDEDVEEIDDIDLALAHILHDLTESKSDLWLDWS
jgi:hypothetical protein